MLIGTRAPDLNDRRVILVILPTDTYITSSNELSSHFTLLPFFFLYQTTPRWLPVHCLEPFITPPTSPFIPLPTSTLKPCTHILPRRSRLLLKSRFRLPRAGHAPAVVN